MLPFLEIYVKFTLYDIIRKKEVFNMVYTIDEIKEKVQPIAEKYDLPAIYLFGSYARNEADEDSDIDLAIELGNSDLLWGGMAPMLEIEEVFEIPVDCLTVESILEARSPIEKEVKKNFEREKVILYEKRTVGKRLFVS